MSALLGTVSLSAPQQLHAFCLLQCTWIKLARRLTHSFRSGEWDNAFVRTLSALTGLNGLNQPHLGTPSVLSAHQVSSPISAQAVSGDLSCLWWAPFFLPSLKLSDGKSFQLHSSPYVLYIYCYSFLLSQPEIIHLKARKGQPCNASHSISLLGWFCQEVIMCAIIHLCW